MSHVEETDTQKDCALIKSGNSDSEPLNYSVPLDKDGEINLKQDDVQISSLLENGTIKKCLKDRHLADFLGGVFGNI